MADITKSVFVTQPGEPVPDAPFSWYAFKIEVPASAVSVGTDDIYLPVMPRGALFIETRLLVMVPCTNGGGTTTANLLLGGYSKTGVSDTWITGPNGLTCESHDIHGDGVNASSTALLNKYTLDYDDGNGPGFYYPAGRVQIVSTTATMTTDLTLVAAFLQGKVTY